MENWKNSFDSQVNHYLFCKDPDLNPIESKNYIKFTDIDIGRKVGFNRVAVHHVTLPPHSRTSSPHAESHEEEFVLVLKGTPDLWLNGYIHPLKAGHAVGFPAGTGIAHTFINNTDDDIHLVVAGEKSKNENLCSFPINPELQSECPIWWDQAPKQVLGPHDGLPKAIQPHELAQAPSEFVVYAPDLPRKTGFHYAGDNETFSVGNRLSTLMKLKSLGIWYEILPPHRRTAFPHAHTHEEEFIFVLKGQPTVWIDGFTKEIGPDFFAAFPSNTGHAHTLINDSDEDVIYLCIGEATDFPDEKISYPLNALRRQECERKNWYWTDAPVHQQGVHNGRPRQAFAEHMSFKLVTADDVEEVLQIFNKSKSYFEKVEGCQPDAKMALKAISEMPSKVTEKYYKQFLKIEYNEHAIGVIDLHVNHPEEKICYLGLLLIEEKLFKKNIGRRCYQLAEHYIKNGLECDKIRLGISAENDVSGFWSNLGFARTGKTYEWSGEMKKTIVTEFEKILNT